MSTPNTFYGREQEIAWLREHFDAIATRGVDGQFPGPRMAVVLAETGLGKSRLVQELYLRLTSDERWDPPACNYWPDAFRSVQDQVHVNPDMHRHVPAGPPRFMWLGVRWQPADVRNPDPRSVLPNLRCEIGVHTATIERHRGVLASAMRRAEQTLRNDAIGEVVEQVADNLLPFGGLLTKLAVGIKRFASEQWNTSESHSDMAQDQAKDITEDLLDCFAALLEGRHAIPAVLWLDDAQWIDPQTGEFLCQIWSRARLHHWPLLIVSTHWEREWREIAQRKTEDQRGTLPSFAGRDGVNVWELKPAQDANLAAYLATRLPGLSAEQQALMLDKAGGNFLTMVENTGDLLTEPMNFEDGEVSGALSPEGADFVATWASERSKRVEQRFKALEPKVKNLLGWSSRLGIRFLHGVVEAFAARVAGQPDAGEMIRRCVDPLVILGAQGSLTREFRDKAFHAVATKHFNTYGRKYEAALKEVLCERLVQWISASFNAKGGLVQPKETTKIGDAKDNSASAMMAKGQHAELRELLEIALRELPAPAAEDADWTDPLTIAWLRAVRLSVEVSSELSLWEDVRCFGKALEAVRWSVVPRSVINDWSRSRLRDQLMTSESVGSVIQIYLYEIENRERAAKDTPSSEAFGDCMASNLNLANWYERYGYLQHAIDTGQEALEWARRQDAAPGKYQHLAASNIVEVLKSLAYRAKLLGRTDEAKKYSAEAKSIATPQFLYDQETGYEFLDERWDKETNIRSADERWSQLDEARARGAVASTLGNLERAFSEYSSALVLSRALAELLEENERHSVICADLRALTNIAARQNNPLLGLVYAKELIECNRLYSPPTDDFDPNTELASSLELAATLSDRAGDSDAASIYRDNLIDICRQIFARNPRPRNLLYLASKIEAASRLALKQGRFDLSRVLCEESLHIYRSRCVEIGSVRCLEKLENVLDLAFDIAEALNDLDGATRHLREYSDVVRRKSDGRQWVTWTLPVNLCSLAHMAEARGDHEAERAFYAEALPFAIELSRGNETDQTKRYIENLTKQLAGTLS